MVTGTSYESLGGRIADRLARRNLGVVRPTVVARAKGNDPTPPLPEANSPAERRTITWEESDKLALADVIISAADQDGREIYIVAEISGTVQEKDREKALERARILEKATKVTTIAAVIGITEEPREKPAGDAPAETANVRFFQFDPDQRRIDPLPQPRTCGRIRWRRSSAPARARRQREESTPPRGREKTMRQDEETTYALEPTAFHSMREAQEVTDALELNLLEMDLGAANVRPELVEMFSEMVNNAAEHGMTPEGAHCHVRYMPHRRGFAFDTVVTDRGPGIRATLERNPDLKPESDEDALRIAVQELTSGTAVPTRGIGLWTIFLECQKPGRKLQLHSGTGRLTVYGPDSVSFSTAPEHRGTIVRFTLPA